MNIYQCSGLDETSGEKFYKEEFTREEMSGEELSGEKFIRQQLTVIRENHTLSV
jgi:hypothetical protein